MKIGTSVTRPASNDRVGSDVQQYVDDVDGIDSDIRKNMGQCRTGEENDDRAEGLEERLGCMPIGRVSKMVSETKRGV